ncbi:hypothetical protein BJ165DRAFT_1398903 [Panaeolus papilionaceus]|nr:hypothetical protein BJ165DRAFT_1398903 [Panaeolus papilionaceus]
MQLQLRLPSTTRSGVQFQVEPVICPPTFDLAAALDGTLALDSDAICFYANTANQDAILPGLEGGYDPTLGPSELEQQSSDDEEDPGIDGLEDGEITHTSNATGAGKLDDLEEGEIDEASLEEHGVSHHPNHHLPFTQCGYQGVQVSSVLSELTEKGYCVIEHKSGVSRPLVDASTQKVIAVVVGVIDDPSYSQAAIDAFKYLDDVARTMNLNPLDFEDNRIKRLGNFASSAFATWAPKVYEFFTSYAQTLCETLPNLVFDFYNSAWLCITVNFGPAVCCLPHRDFLNLSFGWCAIIALGTFNHRLGGHVVLDDLKLVVELPPGGLLLLPSALLTHGNMPIQPGEKRMSFTHFTAAGIFRYIDNGFRTEKQLKKYSKKAYKEMLDKKKTRKEEGTAYWSTIKELLGFDN